MSSQFSNRLSRRRPGGKPGVSHTKFTADEDTLLCKIIAGNVCKNWEMAAESLPGRNARQCRDRRKHYLSYGHTSAAWSAEEDDLLLEEVTKWGPKWTRVAACLCQRTDAEVKMRWLKKFNSVLPMIPKTSRPTWMTQTLPPPTRVVDPLLHEQNPRDQFPLTGRVGEDLTIGNSGPAESQIEE
jgi:hypothetical protein